MKDFAMYVGKSVLISVCAGALYKIGEGACVKIYNRATIKRPLKQGEEVIIRQKNDYVTVVG